MDLDKEELEYTKIINGSMKRKEIIKLIENLKKEKYISKEKILNKIKELKKEEYSGDLAQYIAISNRIEVLKEILGE